MVQNSKSFDVSYVQLLIDNLCKGLLLKVPFGSFDFKPFVHL